MKGKVIYQKNGGIFVQMDKNYQVCDLRSFDKKSPFNERIGKRVYPEILNTFKGRPLYTAWNGLIAAISAINEGKEA